MTSAAQSPVGTTASGAPSIEVIDRPEDAPRAGEAFVIRIAVRDGDARAVLPRLIEVIDTAGQSRHIAPSGGSARDPISLELRAPDISGRHTWRLKATFSSADVGGSGSSSTDAIAQANVVFDVEPQIASLAVWGLPDAAVCGTRFKMCVGATSTMGVMLSGRTVEVHGADGSTVGRGILGKQPWAGTARLAYAEIEVEAPVTPTIASFSATCVTDELAPEHVAKPFAFTLAVSALPRHTIEVLVADRVTGLPLRDCVVRAGAARAISDVNGHARLGLADGAFELSGWCTGYDVPTISIVAGEVHALIVEAIAIPDEDPDARWTA